MWGFSGYSVGYILSISVNVLILGVIFGVIYKKSGTLWAPIILHSGYNLFINI
ncbi:CPBP family glutamic-type intramembrane protease [Paenibacillus anaericanus]|uniref:CPBP family glutamic-type intramembrane protease n=1 Tax=Paenibacillus TaxID=44249 RepID=UPI0035221814